MHETSLLNDPVLWYTVAVVIFFAGVFFGAKAPIVGWLDGEIAKVRTELDEARRLRTEAEAQLEEYRRRQREAMNEAEEIVSQAKSDAARLRREAETELADLLKRHEQVALDRIHMAQEDAVADVRSYVIEEAMLLARQELAKKASGAEAQKLIDQIITDLPKLSKTKVA